MQTAFANIFHTLFLIFTVYACTSTSSHMEFRDRGGSDEPKLTICKKRVTTSFVNTGISLTVINERGLVKMTYLKNT